MRCPPLGERGYRWLAVGLVCLSFFFRLEGIRRADAPTLPAPLAEGISQAGILYIDRHLPQDWVFLLCAGAQEKVSVEALDNLPKDDRDTCHSIDGHLVCF
ncbi:hypothetical protein CLV84_0241 [Neolewinella xylanilytica]|uniref:Uncharacterized protein n=1 Tax=Neolewinella xylanilytica TaxID=1514080 RepID=A0A2S6I727_9BACT|nr:hypothetical protein [Neolewinella xylanilytica]PPK87303.1 hypothetical protein CLV84_0241 [Neolewinella xylanilytica]